MRFWKANRRLLNRMSYMSDGTISLSIFSAPDLDS
jgi:hypothetical protein